MSQPITAEILEQFVQALAWHEAGALEQAVAAYGRLVRRRPDFFEVHNNLSLALAALGRYDAAAEACRRGLDCQPSAQGQQNLGHFLLLAGRPEEALAAVGAALRLNPDYAQAWNSLGNIRLALRQPQAAVEAFGRAIALIPGYAEAQSNLGGALRQLEQPGPALEACRRAAALKPGDADILNNLGNALLANERDDEALDCFRRVVALAPGHADGLNNLGNMLRARHRLDEALAVYERGRAAAPQHALLRLNYAMALLQRGRFHEGWAEYEERWKTERYRSRRIVSDRPEWDGGRLDGRTIILYGEQGLGDVLQFARYAPLVAAASGGRVVLRVPPSLRRLLESVPGVAAVVGGDQPLPPHDGHLPLMSAPRLLGTTADRIPAEIPYLCADPAAVEGWRRRLAPLPGRKVGLVWSGDPRPGDADSAAMDRRRSLSLDRFAAFAGLDGLSLVSLQKGAAAQAVAAMPALRLFDPMAEMADFADTAALVAALDLVISVDTAVAHLAGALGKPVWILSRYDGCWRWPPEREDSPWYPSARLFHQRRPGDWDEVVRRLEAALRAETTDQA